MPTVNASWNGATADWNTPADWSDDIVPNTSNTDVTLDGSGAYTISIAAGEGFTTGTVLLNDANAAFDIAGILDTGALTVGPGTVDITGTVDATGAVDISGGFTNSGTLDVDTGSGQGGGSLTITGTLDNNGAVQVGPSNLTLSGPTPVTLGGLTNGSSASFIVYGSASYAATLAFSGSGSGFTSNAGSFQLWYATPLTLSSSFTNSGNFGLHQNSAVTVNGDFTNSSALNVDNIATDVGGLAEGGSSLTVTGTLANTGAVQVGDTSLALRAATTVTLGGLTNGSSASFIVYGSASHAATLAFSGSGSGFTSNAGSFQLWYATPLTLSSSFTNSGNFGLHQNSAVTVNGDFTNSSALNVDNIATDVGGLAEGGSSLTVTGTLANTGAVQVGDTSLALRAATTVTLGGLTNGSSASFIVYGSASHAATLAFSGSGSGFTSNAGSFQLWYATPLTLSSSFTNSGNFGLHQNSAVTVNGDFTNSSALNVDNIATDVGGLAEGGSSLTVTGTLANTGAVQVGDTSLALRAATTVTLGGLTNGSSASFIVYGSASHAATLAFSGSGSGFTSNAGSFQLWYATPLTLSSSFTNSGNFGLHQNSAVTVNGDFTNSSALNVDNIATDVGGLAEGGSSLTVTGTLANTGAVQVGDTSLALRAATTVTLGGLTNGSSASFTLDGSASYAATLAVAGPTGNAGTLNIGSYSALDVTGGNAFTQTGGVTTVNGTLSAATIDIDGGTLVFNTTNFTDTGTLAAADGGLINFSAGGLTNLSGMTLSGGTYEVDAGSTLQLPNNVYITTLAADLILSGTGSVVESLDTGTNVQVQLESTLSTIAVGGTLNVAGGRSYTTANTIADAGALQIGGGGTFTAAAVSVAGGAMLTVGAGSNLDLNSTLMVNGTLINAGTVSGGGTTAVQFGSGTDRLILDPGATFLGTVVGGGANTTLELAASSGAGTLNALGTTFTNFGTVTVDAGAIWTVDAASSLLATTTFIGDGASSTLVLTGTGTFSLAEVSNFGTIDLPAGNNTVTVTDTTLSGGSVTINDGTSGNNTVSAASDTSVSQGKTLTYDTGVGTDSFTGGFENDTVGVSVAALSGDALTSGSGTNTLVLTTAGVPTFSGVSNFATIDLAAGNSTVAVTDAMLSVGALTINDGASGNNTVSAAGDTAASKGKTLTYDTGVGTDSFTGGFENDTVGVSVAALAGDTLSGGSGTNTLVLTTAGVPTFSGVTNFATIDLAAGNSTVTVTGAMLSGGSVTINDGASGNNTVSAAGDTSASKGKTLTYNAGTGTDSFTGGFENDKVNVSAAAVGRDTLTGGSGTNTLTLTSAGTASLGGVSKFPTIDLAAGNSTVTVTDTTLSSGAVTINDGASGNNSVSAGGDTSASKGKTLIYNEGTGTDSFTGGFENDKVNVSAAAIGGDTLTGGSGTNTLVLTTAGTANLGGVSKFPTIDLAAGNSTVTVTDTTLSGGSVTLHDGESGDNSVSAAGDTAASTGKTLTYDSGTGTDSLTGGFENDVVYVTAVGGDTLTGGSGTNTLELTTAATFSLGGVSKFGAIFLGAGNNTVTVTDKTLSGGLVTLHDGASGNNSIRAAGDTSASTGKTLAYFSGTGTDTFTGGFENDSVHVSTVAVGGNTMTGGSGTNTLILSSAGAVNLAGVSKFATIDLFTGNSTVTVTDTTLSGGSVKINDGASGNNTVSAAGDTSASAGKSLSYFTGTGTDSFSGGFENDLVYVSAAVGGDTLTGGSGANTLILTSAGTVNLGGVSKFATINLAAGNSTVTVTNETLSGGTVTLHVGASGNNTVSAAGDSGASGGKTLIYNAGTGTDSFTGGFETDEINVSAAAVGGDTLTGGSASNTLILTSAGTFSLGSVSKFASIDFAAGNSTVTLTDKTLSGAPVTLHDTTGNNTVSAASDTSASKGKTLTYYPGPGTVTFTGGFENDLVHVSAAAVGGDVLTGGSGTNILTLSTAGTVNLGGVSKFVGIYLAAGNSTVTVTDKTLSGGAVAINDGASGNNTVSAASDTSASKGKALSYFAGTGTDSFTGGFENDVVYVTAATVGGDVLTGGSGSNTLILTRAGTVNLGGVSEFRGIYLAADNSTVTVTDTTLSGGSATINDGASGNNTVSAAGDTSASTGKMLTYFAGTGSDRFTGGFENDTAHVSAAAVDGDVLTGGSGTNTLILSSVGTANLAGVSKFGTVDLAAGNSTVTVTDTTLSGGAVKINDGASGNNTVSAAGDSSASTGETLSYFTGTGTDTFTGGFENDTIYVSAAAVGGDVLTGGSGTTTVVLTSAGTATLNADDDDLIVKLDHGTNLTLSTMSFITADGGSGNDTITALAQGQTLIGGAADTLIGFSGFGNTFAGKSAGMNGDMIKLFGGSDVIDLTDMSSSTAKALVYTGTTSSGTLTVADGIHTANINFTGDYTTSNFQLTTDHHGGSVISFV